MEKRYGWSIWLLMIVHVCSTKMDVYDKVCTGTDQGLHSIVQRSTERYKNYQEMYMNCTLVEMNLEIVYLEGIYDMTFLETIQEVTGYVLIYGNFIDSLPLSSLKIIRGRKTYRTETEKENNFALYIAANKGYNSSHGLKQVKLTSLEEILNGDVLFKENDYLCYENYSAINWTYILNRPKAQALFPQSVKKFCDINCHPNCSVDKNKFCWGEGVENCQKLTKLSCSPSCQSWGCYDSGGVKCCNKECVAGCTGPSIKDCVACRHFLDDGECVPVCNDKFTDYNQETGHFEKTILRYMYIDKCVNKCPDNWLTQQKTCVTKCSPGYIANGNRTCVECQGPCPKICHGDETTGIDKDNIYDFLNCTKLEGSLVITDATFDSLTGISGHELDFLNNIKEITKYLHIETDFANLTSLSFLKNLQIIQGQGLYLRKYSVYISHTKMHSLGLNSLQLIQDGSVYISDNPLLCYVSTILWESLFSNKEKQKISNITNLNNCGNCSNLCSIRGCWGPDENQCLSCMDYKLYGHCTSTCDPVQNKFVVDQNGTRECHNCSSECLDGCVNYGPDNCNHCRYAKLDSVCVNECPTNKYVDEKGECHPCHTYCTHCNGSKNHIGPEGCTQCRGKVLVNSTEDGNRISINNTVCLAPDKPCPDGYFDADMKLYGFKQEACKPCHEECIKCEGPHQYDCKRQCKNYYQLKDHRGECVVNCSYLEGYFDNGKKECIVCNEQCKRCQNDNSCSSCKHVKLPWYHDEIPILDHVPVLSSINGTIFEYACARTCPSEKYYEARKINVFNETEWICEVKQNNNIIIWTLVSIVLIVLSITFTLLWIFVRKQKEARLRESLLASDDVPMISCSNARPDMSCLRIIKETELRLGEIIGSGAFGTVYKGYWVPEKENLKIPVAIKILQDDSSTSQNVELLDEARIMASVVNRNCVRILAVCMANKMMLITQLMPLGSLLEYIRSHKNNTGSRTLLTWSLQIAKGMQYLEECGIVHRDLAARNVLVESSHLVKITDFGLAKLLDCNEDKFCSEGGKMPIKWLALESIQHQIYTHKSDVWSFGVTLWEMFTYGERPYENIPAHDIPDLLEKGERLPQPAICTIDVYMIMIKCWLIDASGRPSFSSLSVEFTRMAQDPGRFLVIPGDTLMRLPSITPDSMDICYPSDSGSEILLTAEEYLTPRDLRNQAGKLTSIMEDDQYENTDNIDSFHDEHINRPKPLSNREISQRYTSEPFESKKEQIPDADMPLSSLFETGPPYMEVIDNSNTSTPTNEDPVSVAAIYLDMSTNHSKNNPEYYISESIQKNDPDWKQASSKKQKDPTYFNC